MPRKAHTDPPKKVTITLPETLKAEVDLLLFDPVRGKRAYGDLSTLIARLLREWVETKRTIEETP